MARPDATTVGCHRLRAGGRRPNLPRDLYRAVRSSVVKCVQPPGPSARGIRPKGCRRPSVIEVDPVDEPQGGRFADMDIVVIANEHGAGRPPVAYQGEWAGNRASTSAPLVSHRRRSSAKIDVRPL